MKNRYQVIFWHHENPYTSALTGQVCKSFKNLKSAMKLAEKLNEKHCRETRFARRRTTFVDVHKVGIGCVAELEPVIVPSVGELGYW